jgi:hypothetical protein
MVVLVVLLVVGVAEVVAEHVLALVVMVGLVVVVK